MPPPGGLRDGSDGMVMSTFGGGVFCYVLPAGLDTPPDVWVEGSQINVAMFDDGLADDSAAVARIRSPDGSIATEPLTRATSSSFEGTFPAGSPGAYWVAVTITDQQGGTKTVSSGTVSSYEPEFAFREPDPTLAVDLAEVTSGRKRNPDASTVWFRHRSEGHRLADFCHGY